MRITTSFPTLKRSHIIGVISLVLLLLVLPVNVFFSQRRQEYKQHAATSCPINGGVSRNPAGIYHFSWLHIASGKIFDEQGCPVTLAGFNTAGLEFGDGYAGFSMNRIQTFHQSFNMNIWRVSISPVWWNDNDYVPAVKMKYQDWIKQVISWMEQNGNYVELDPTSYHSIPPCGGGVPYCAQNNNTPPCCTSQNTPNNPPWTEQQKLDATQQFWQSIVPIYKDDPAILYDALNEPYAPAFSNYHNDLSQMITIIQQINPKAMVFVFGNSMANIVNGTVPDFTGNNLIYTFHPYPDPSNPWQGKLARIQGMIPWIQNHNHGVSIEEWGDGNLANNVAYADGVLSIVKTYGAATTYYYSGNAMTANGQETSVGQVLQNEYATLPQLITIVIPSPTPTPTITPIPSSANTPTPTQQATPTSTLMPSPTATPLPNVTRMAVTILLDGIGTTGDNENRNGGGNMNPLHPQRTLSFAVFNNQNIEVASQAGIISFQSSGDFTGTIAIPNLPTGTYMLKVKMDQYLRALLPGIQNITTGQANQLPAVTLVAGDINGDNIINILDYNILMSCYSDLLPPTNCNATSQVHSDLNDDGAVNQFDYNLFLRELTNRGGQ